MALDAEVQAMLDELVTAGRPTSRSLPLDEGRRNFAELFASLTATEEVRDVRDMWFEGPGGHLPVRVYSPAAPRPRPLVVFFHGGGWVFGDAETHDGLCRQLANAAGSTVASVAYRRAPEHPFPAAAEDAHAATAWAFQHAEELEGDPRRLAVAGDSAGANLAAAASLMARDRGGPPIALQVLAFPVLDSSMSTASYTQFADDPFLSRDEMAWYWDQYAPGAADRTDPYASPAAASDLTGLPPALVITAEIDVLRDEGEAYSARLRDAGVPVDAHCHMGTVHDFMVFGRALGAAGRAVSTIGRAIAGAAPTG